MKIHDLWWIFDEKQTKKFDTPISSSVHYAQRSHLVVVHNAVWRDQWSRSERRFRQWSGNLSIVCVVRHRFTVRWNSETTDRGEPALSLNGAAPRGRVRQETLDVSGRVHLRTARGHLHVPAGGHMQLAPPPAQVQQEFKSIKTAQNTPHTSKNFLKHPSQNLKRP